MRSIQRAHGTVDPKQFASLGVALCLALAGAGIGLIVARAHHGANDTLLPMDGPAQRELRDGWRELGTLAASFPPAIPSPVSLPSPAPAPPPAGPARSNAAPPQTAGDGLGGSGGDSGNGGAAGNSPAPRPIQRTYPASQSCGLATCNDDSVCCNPSCGICTAPGAECSQRACG